MKVLDLTHTIRAEMPVYPGTEPPELTTANTYAADGFQETLLRMYSHTGTHIDPPAHLFAGARTLDRYPAWPRVAVQAGNSFVRASSFAKSCRNPGVSKPV